MISVRKEVLEDIIANNKVLIDKKIETRKKRLKHKLWLSPSPISDPDEIKYLDLLVQDYEKIVFANPDKLDYYKDEFDKIITGTRMILNHKPFKDKVVEYMGYKTLRNSFYPKFFDQIGIKTCIYCNSQSAISVRKSNGKITARFEVDHYYPKSHYPCLSTSFFNLYPSCGECNGRKSKNLVEFKLYTADPKETNSSVFSFELDKASLVKYKVNGNQENLKIRFIEPLNTGFNKSFAITGIYNTQKDLTEELVIKSMIYTEKYKESLRTSFKKLYKHKVGMSNRLIIGNYTDIKDIHKRPMAKFTQDISRQLGLID